MAEIWSLAGLLLVAFILGLVFGHVSLFMLVATLGYLGWTFYNLYHLRRWLAIGRKYHPPDSFGIWGDIFTEIFRLQRRNKKRQKRLVKLLGRFRETTEAMPDGVVVMQASGVIEWWNEAGGRLLDLKYPQDVGQRLTNLIRNPEFLSFIENNNRHEVLNFAAPADKNKIIAVQLTPYGMDQSLLIVRDVTILQRVEQIRRDFVANISHELRTPLTVMSGFLETLTGDDTITDKNLRRSLELMKQQSKRMYRLVEDLMLLSKLENEQRPVKHEVVAVPQLLTTLREEAMIISGDRNHQITLDVDLDLYLYGDSKELDSAFSNLVINAVNYTPTGGAINIRWYQDDTGAHLSVSDTGIGIPPHHLSRITERFYRVDVARSRETGGSGLGLAIVKHALGRHAAHLRIDSEVGRGSTFICDFPPEAMVNKSEAREAI
ncbi:MAG: phosphate regulon sensor histidine kinase PhoR [Gammaproteobacteria bacterium]|nr:phosphate regulon sensor histidine kinase PhoR [Gammaproteobacteria bacterium]